MKKPRTLRQWLVDAGAILCAAVVVVLAVGTVRDLRLWQNPETSIAVVIDKRVSNGAEGGTFYQVRYSFTPSSGRQFLGEANLRHELYDETSLGDRIQIQYAADEPGRSRAINEVRDPVGSFIAVATWTASFFAMFIYYGPRRWLRTLKGQPEPPWE
jgi:hypothetical protein